MRQKYAFKPFVLSPSAGLRVNETRIFLDFRQRILIKESGREAEELTPAHAQVPSERCLRTGFA
jgi:hypothetical protein